MYQERSIIHFNVADFAVAVERVADSSRRHRPLVIAPLQSARAVVYDMSEEAFACGVRKGMPLSRITRLCPQAVVVPPQFDLYQRAMRECIRRVSRFSEQIEHGLVDGHLFVDVTGTHRLFGPAPDIGWKVRNDICADLGVDPIWTLSSSKLVAKVASRIVKPVGEYIVPAGEEEEFLAPLAVDLLPGITLPEVRKLRELNIRRVGQIASLSRDELMVPFGGRGDFFYDISRGIDMTKVACGHEQTVPVCYEHHFADDTNDRGQVTLAVRDLADRAGMELRQRKQAARRLCLKITYSDGSCVVRQASRPVGSASDFVLRDQAVTILQRAWTRRTRLRSCQLVCDRLHRQSSQLSLLSLSPEQRREPEGVLAAMDRIRHRFGHDLIKAGSRVVAVGLPAVG